MKKQVVLALIATLSVICIGCGKKEEEKTPITPTPDVVEETNEDDDNPDVKWLKETFIDPSEVFTHASKIDDEAYVNWEGDPVRYIVIYGEWTEEEFETYKNEAIKAGEFTVDSYEYENHYGAWSKDKKWYFTIGESEEGDEKVLNINIG